MTKAEFISKWRGVLAGRICLGTSTFRASLKKAMIAASVDDVDVLGVILANVGHETDALLAKIFDDLCREAAMPNTPSTPAATKAVHTNGSTK